MFSPPRSGAYLFWSIVLATIAALLFFTQPLGNILSVVLAIISLAGACSTWLGWAWLLAVQDYERRRCAESMSIEVRIIEGVARMTTEWQRDLLLQILGQIEYEATYDVHDDPGININGERVPRSFLVEFVAGATTNQEGRITLRSVRRYNDPPYTRQDRRYAQLVTNYLVHGAHVAMLAAGSRAAVVKDDDMAAVLEALGLKGERG